MKWLKKLFGERKPVDEALLRRARIGILCAGAGASLRAEDGKVHVEVEGNEKS